MRAKKPKALGVYAGSFDPLTIGQGGMRNINGDLDPGVCTVFLMPPREIAEVSSSMVKGLIGPVGWEKIVRKYVPAPVFKRLKGLKR